MNDPARGRAEMPAGADRILDQRSLATSHRRLAELLRPGMRVLDVGCGTGAITRDVAAAVAPGNAVGLDINQALLRQAAALRGGSTNLCFVRADIYTLPFADTFDIATAARVLLWLSQPADAVRQLAGTVKSDGKVVVLDYDHERIEWDPEPPASVGRFYRAFLTWRAEAGMDNAIAGRLPALFESAGLVDIAISPQHERTRRGDVDFGARIGIWADVAGSRGHQMVGDGAISEAERATAEADYRDWAHTHARSQAMYLLAVEGTVRKTNRGRPSGV
jgi:SAM-dependent methyltransferase